MAAKNKQDKDPVDRRHEKEMKELQDIKQLIVLLLIRQGVQVGEIEETLELGSGNFSKAYRASNLIKRMKKEAARNGKKED